MGNRKHDAKNAVVLRSAPMGNSKPCAKTVGDLVSVLMEEKKNDAKTVVALRFALTGNSKHNVKTVVDLHSVPMGNAK